ncbi:MAG: hypothetical protein IT373_07855 [Polyangiaceae bacterium]|nr:hypothetical protein [Polyangiaceae bacterium]
MAELDEAHTVEPGAGGMAQPGSARSSSAAQWTVGARAVGRTAAGLALRVIGWGLGLATAAAVLFVVLRLARAGALAADWHGLEWLGLPLYGLVGGAIGAKIGAARGIGRGVVELGVRSGLVRSGAAQVLDLAEELLVRTGGAAALEALPLARVEGAVKQAVLEITGSGIASQRSGAPEPAGRLQRAAFARIERYLLAQARSEAGAVSLPKLRALALAEVERRVEGAVDDWARRTTLLGLALLVVLLVGTPFLLLPLLHVMG